MGTVLITGANRGIGLELSRQLSRRGDEVIALCRKASPELEALEVQVFEKADVTDAAALEAVSRDLGDTKIDVLINNAGFGLYGPVEDVPIDDARYQFEVNLFGLARLTQLVLPYMRAKKAGKIVNISSMGGKIYTPLGSWYHATKHALMVLSTTPPTAPHEIVDCGVAPAGHG